jgi:hypothetical protein
LREGVAALGLVCLDVFWQVVRFHLLITLVTLHKVFRVPTAHLGGGGGQLAVGGCRGVVPGLGPGAPSPSNQGVLAMPGHSLPSDGVMSSVRGDANCRRPSCRDGWAAHWAPGSGVVMMGTNGVTMLHFLGDGDVRAPLLSRAYVELVGEVLENGVQ